MRCEEGKEPNHLIAMFGGGMAILSGETEEHSSLFHIRLNKANQVKAYEVEAKAANLNSNDTFLLAKAGDSPYGYDDAAWAWFGAGGSDKEKEALSRLAEKIGISDIEELEEGGESDEFWEALGGQDDYFTLPRTQVRNL